MLFLLGKKNSRRGESFDSQTYALPNLRGDRAGGWFQKLRPMLTIVDSTQCHLWTDALHARQLAREALNKWDRGTYVRMCVTTGWTALEVACQEAMSCPDIGYRFKDNLDRAIAAASLAPIDWSSGVWQRVRQLQELRKLYVHRFASLNDMFPLVAVAEEAIETVRGAIVSIYEHVGRETPIWTGLNEARGWQARSSFGSAVLTMVHAGVKIEDPLAVRVFMVIDGEENLASILPAGYSPTQEINHLIQNVRLPISGIRVYENGELKQDLVVNMRGNT